MRLKALHHVSFAVSDLGRQESFAKDFGLVTAQHTETMLAMRTRGGDECTYVARKADEDRFVGLAFEVEGEDCLNAAIRDFGAKEVETLDVPGGGSAVSLNDPDGNEILLVSGSARREAEEPVYEKLVLNTPFCKERFGRSQSAREVGPACLWRLGHIGLFVQNYRESYDWYTKKLGLIASDIYHIPGKPEAEIVAFCRLDRGEEYVDHHVVALMQDERGGCHHISFEAQDFEAQHRTHRFLKRQEYESIWGVGRHPHGSHVFDVWRGPDGARFETFSDTDLFRASDGTNIHDISKVMMDAWLDDGPERYFV